jgi:hypothetical protein
MKVNWLIFGSFDGGEVTMEGDVGVVVCQHGAGECLNLGEE